MNWLILRILRGQPLKVADTITRLGTPAYCPHELVKRRHPKGKQIFIHRQPLYPGFVFVPGTWNEEAQAYIAPITTEAIGAAILEANKERTNPNRPNRPKTLSTGLMWAKGQLTPQAMEQVRRSETDTALRFGIIEALNDIAGVVGKRKPKRRFTKDWRGVLQHVAA